MKIEREKAIVKQKPLQNIHFSPKKIKTHLLYKRLNQIKLDSKIEGSSFSLHNNTSNLMVTQKDFFLDNDQTINNKNSMNSMNSSSRISSKTSKEDFYFGFKESNLRKLEVIKKFEELKEKTKFTIGQSQNQNFLMSLRNETDMPKKLLRDINKIKTNGKKNNTHRSSLASKNRIRNEERDQRARTGVSDFNTSLFRSNYNKIQAFTHIKQNGKIETNSELIGYMKFYSGKQKNDIEKQLLFKSDDSNEKKISLEIKSSKK